MEYFYLAYGKMSLRCLNDLINMNLAPKLVITHKTYDFENQKKEFYNEIDKICKSNNIKIIYTDTIIKHKKDIKGFKLGVCAGFMEIIKKGVFQIPEYGILNLHCGELPYYRGRAPISRTIIDGNDTLFLTIHKMDEGVDSGDILVQKEIIIEEDDDVNSLYYKCSINCASVVNEAITKIATKNDNYTKQDLSIKPKPNQKITEEERIINWNDSLKHIYDKIRGLAHPYPSAMTKYNKDVYYIIKSKPLYSIDLKKSAGKILTIENDFILVECKDGFLMIYEIRNKNFKKVDFKKVFKNGGEFS